ncbi:U1 small nuclear ribonucleoprotein C-like protein [Tanacetum coccineum]
MHFPIKDMYSPEVSDSFQYTGSFQETAREGSSLEVAAPSPKSKSKPTRGHQKRTVQTEDAPRQIAWTNEEEITLCKGWIHKSGAGDEDYFNRALLDYEAEHGMQFTLRHCWEAKCMKKKGARSSGSSSSMNNEALDRLMVSELAMHNGRAIGMKKEERLAFMEIKRREPYEHLTGDALARMEALRAEIEAKWNLPYSYTDSDWYYCDYCDTYLTHDSPSVRKQHNAGYKHKGNVRTYYQQYEAQQNQYLIDQKVKEHLGQAAAYQQVGAAYNQMRPRLPMLPNPMMPMPGNPQMAMNPALYPGMRPLAPLPRPMPGYPPMPPMLAPPGAPGMPGQVNPSMPGQVNPSAPGQVNPSMPGQVNPSMPGQVNPSMPGQINNGMPRPMTMNPQMMAPGSSGPPTSGAPPPMYTQTMYQANPTGPGPASGSLNSPNTGAQSQEASH